MGIAGRYFSFTSGSVDAGTDLIEEAEKLSGNSNIVAKKLTLVSSGCVIVNINSSGSSHLLENTDHQWVLSFDAGDILVSSLRISNSSASQIYLALVY